MQEAIIMSQPAKATGDWQEWYAQWEQQCGQWLEPENRPVTREDQIQTAWAYYTERMRDDLVQCIKPLLIHVDYVCRVGDLLTREDHECWHATAVALAAACNEVLARYGYAEVTCKTPAAFGAVIGSCCRCGKQH
jgi:hypothetical protein